MRYFDKLTDMRYLDVCEYIATIGTADYVVTRAVSPQIVGQIPLQ